MPRQPMDPQTRQQVHDERNQLLDHVLALLDKPMIVLSVAWMALMIIDFTSGLDRPLSIVRYVIWGLFAADFALEFAIAPGKLAYLRGHWLTALALALPAFRVLRAVRLVSIVAVHLGGSLNLLRMLGTLNRTLAAARTSLAHRGIGPVIAFTAAVVFVGAAGMYAFERPAALRLAGRPDMAQSGGGLHSYGEALWWTGMMMTSIGSDYFPVTINGRILCWLLAVYALSVFGYITASVASLFVGKDAGIQQAQPPPEDARALRDEIAALRGDIASLTNRLSGHAA